MFSPVFVLCSALLITGTLADSKFFSFSDPKEYQDAAMKAGMAVFADVISGKDIQEALTEHGLKATSSLKDELSSIAKSALKRIKELQDGGSYEDAVAKIGKAILNKGAGKFEKVGDFVKLVGDDNLKTIMEKGSKLLTKLVGKN